MNNWSIIYLEEAQKDFEELDGNEKRLVLKAINKVATNPLPSSEGGYGKELGHKNGNNLTGLLKIKLKNAGIRIVYYIVKKDKEMNIVIIGARKDNNVYNNAVKRVRKYTFFNKKRK